MLQQPSIETKGHDEVHGGLRGHSIGEYYPCVIEHYGDGGRAVRLGQVVTKRFYTRYATEVVAAHAKFLIEDKGYLAAEDYISFYAEGTSAEL